MVAAQERCEYVKSYPDIVKLFLKIKMTADGPSGLKLPRIVVYLGDEEAGMKEARERHPDACVWHPTKTRDIGNKYDYEHTLIILIYSQATRSCCHLHKPKLKHLTHFLFSKPTLPAGILLLMIPHCPPTQRSLINCALPLTRFTTY